MSEELKTAKNNLSSALGSSLSGYLRLLRKWFCQNISKEEFDEQARLLFTIETIHYHNEFLAALLTKCHIKQPTKRANSPTLTGFKALKRIKRSLSSSSNLNNEKNFQSSRRLNSANVIDASAALTLAHANGVVPVLCSKEGILPDPSMIHGRILVACWENDLEDVEDAVLSLVIYALRDALKNLIHGCVELRRPHLLHDNSFQHLFGADPSCSKNFASSNVRHRIVGETMELKQSSALAACVNRPKSKISLFDLMQAMKLRQSLIPQKSLHSCLLEKISDKIKCKSNV